MLALNSLNFFLFSLLFLNLFYFVVEKNAMERKYSEPTLLLDIPSIKGGG